MNNAAKDYMLNQFKTVATKIALYGTSAEVTGTGYTRQDITWGTSTGGVLEATSIPAFNVPAGQTVAHVKLFNAAGSTEYASFDVSDEEFSNAGTYTITELKLDLNK